MTRLAWAIGGCLLLVGGAAPLVAIAQSPPRPYAEALRDCGVFWWQSRGTSRTSPIALGIAKGHVPDREVTPLAGEIPERFIPRRCRPPAFTPPLAEVMAPSHGRSLVDATAILRASGDIWRAWECAFFGDMPITSPLLSCGCDELCRRMLGPPAGAGVTQ